MPDGLAQGELIGVFGPGQRVAEDVGVERPARVDVRLAEEDVAQRVLLRVGERRGSGKACPEHNGDKPPNREFVANPCVPRTLPHACLRPVSGNFPAARHCSADCTYGNPARAGLNVTDP